MTKYLTSDINVYFNESYYKLLKQSFSSTTDALNDQERSIQRSTNDMLTGVIFGPGDDFVQGGVDRYPDENRRIVVDFHNDYLLDIIKDSFDLYRKEIFEILNNPNMSNLKTQYNYLNVKIEELEDYIVKAEKTEHLEKVKESFIKEIHKLIVEFEAKKPKKYDDLSENKLRFDLTKKEVCLLFTYLSKHNTIFHDQSSDGSLARQIELHFMYLDQKSNTYKTITNASKTIGKNRNDPLHKTESEKLSKILKLKYQ